MRRCQQQSEGILFVDFEAPALGCFVRPFGEHVVEKRKQSIGNELFTAFRKRRGDGRLAFIGPKRIVIPKSIMSVVGLGKCSGQYAAAVYP